MHGIRGRSHGSRARDAARLGEAVLEPAAGEALPVLPLELDPGQDHNTLGLTGYETFDVDGIAAGLSPKKRLKVTATCPNGKKIPFEVTCRIDTPNEVDYYVHGGILVYMLRQLAKG